MKIKRKDMNNRKYSYTKKNLSAEYLFAKEEKNISINFVSW